jgi:hypothetical protein
MGRAWHALLAYGAITMVSTWPLAGGLARDVAWDLGDSVLNMWILAWDCEQLLGILRGDLSRVATFFDANIFHPAPLTLAYSEHLFPQALQILPVYAITKNPILCYNLLFLSTFVLSGLGMYLLVRELTGHALAAFIAGLLFAFAPYRLPQSSHLQILSSQWMPFVLVGLRRYFERSGEAADSKVRSRKLWPLVGASVALAMQSLSSGYYLLYFGPFAAGYALWEVAARRRWRDGRTWLHLAAAGALTGALVTPFLLPYAEVHRRFQAERTLTEVSRFSADVYSYATAFPEQFVWGHVARAFPKPEGELFPGIVAILLAFVGVIWVPRSSDAAETGDPGAESAMAAVSHWRHTAIVVLSIAAAGHAGLALLAVILRRITMDVGPFELRVTDVTQVLLRGSVAFGLVLALSPAVRSRTAAFLRHRGFFVVGLVAAAWLSLGPTPRALGQPLDLIAPYRWLFEYVPGFDGLRVPARFGMIVACMLAVLGGFGVAALARSTAGRTISIALAAVFMFEGAVPPFPVNGLTPPEGFIAPEARLYPLADAPTIYSKGTTQLRGAVIAELPLGHPEFDLRAMYYSIVHGHRILNGYSGFYPPHYGRLVSALSDLPDAPDMALQTLRAAGATHVLVHEGSYLGREGLETTAALRAFGATELSRDRSDVLLTLPR